MAPLFCHIQRPTLTSTERPGRGMSQFSWDENEEYLYFLGDADNGRRQIFRLELKSGTSRVFIAHPENITWFLHAQETFVFGDDNISARATELTSYPVQVSQRRIRRDWDWDYLSGPIIGLGAQTGQQRTFVKYGNIPARQLDENYGNSGYRTLWLAPNGESAIVISRGEFVRLRFSNFSQTHIAAVVSSSYRYPVAKVIPPEPEVFWGTDSSMLMVVGLLNPAGQPALCAYDVQRSSLNSVCSFVHDGQLLASVKRLGEDELELTHIDMKASTRTSTLVKMSAPEVFANGSGPRKKPEASVLLSSISVLMRQSANDPPQVFASIDGVERPLLPPDPALQGVWRAPQVPFRWTDPDGELVSGGLYLPREYRQGERIPLVIQAYHYLPEVFLPDGEDFTVGAAQLLAARGIGVLTYNLPTFGQTEGAKAVERLEAAVSALAAAGIADESKVGLTGFSRAGYQAFYILTHAKRVRLAAAINADSFTGSYSEYLGSAAYTGNGAEFERIYGSSFWHDRQRWIQEETTFNIDKITTPLMVTQHSYDMYGYPIVSRIGAFLLNRRPLEYLYFPNASHRLQRPREREAMLNATLDWLSFWLQDYEDSNTAKTEQYLRWRGIRKDWLIQQAWEAAGHPAGSIPDKDFKLPKKKDDNSKGASQVKEPKPEKILKENLRTAIRGHVLNIDK